MDALECIVTRRSIRKYKDKPVPWDMVATILDAGRLAPSSGNVQSWKFIIVRDESQRKAIAEACLQQHWMVQAPVHFAIIAMPEKVKRYYGVRGERMYAIQNCAAAAENMLLAAHALGLGACWVSAFDEDMLHRALGLPEEVIPQAVITVGWADEQPEQPPKDRAFAKFFLDRWGSRKRIPASSVGWWSARTEKYLKEGVKNIKKLHEKVSKKVKERLSSK
ncbi:nitroreductase family protein [Candidatus Woesearchaeota archaeon]|nr:nitroreductase family protein [Candidatus Woesearchaeota archaeon]